MQDAGLVPGGFERNGNWAETPSATYDKTRFPRGLKPVADAAHVRRTIIAGPWVAFVQERQQQSCGQDVGLKLLIWHEPERVLANTTLVRRTMIAGIWVVAFPKSVSSDRANRPTRGRSGC